MDEDPDGNGQNVVVNVRFPEQYYDVESGLYDNYFRYYDPGTGRYITSDPIGLVGVLNTYEYVGGNPVHLLDPNGLYGTPIHGIITVAAMISKGENPMTSAFVAGTNMGFDFR